MWALRCQATYPGSLAPGPACATSGESGFLGAFGCVRAEDGSTAALLWGPTSSVASGASSPAGSEAFAHLKMSSHTSNRAQRNFNTGNFFL